LYIQFGLLDPRVHGSLDTWVPTYLQNFYSIHLDLMCSSWSTSQQVPTHEDADDVNTKYLLHTPWLLRLSVSVVCAGTSRPSSAGELGNPNYPSYWGFEGMDVQYTVLCKITEHPPHPRRQPSAVCALPQYLLRKVTRVDLE